jgi:hypothetical protein
VTRRPATFERPSNPGRGATTGPWWRFLAEASESLDASLEYQETLTNVLRLAVPKIADYAIITVRANDGSLHWAGARHRDPKKASLVDRLQAYVPPDAAHRHPSVDAVQSGKTQVVDIVDENYLRSVARDETHLELLRQLEPTSYVVIPLEARGRVLGSLLFATARESGRAYRDRDVALAKETGKRISRGCTCQCFRSATNDHTVFDLTLGSEPSGSITRWWSPGDAISVGGAACPARHDAERAGTPLWSHISHDQPYVYEQSQRRLASRTRQDRRCARGSSGRLNRRDREGPARQAAQSVRQLTRAGTRCCYVNAT